MINHENPLLNRPVVSNEITKLICGSFTDWRYKEMMSLESFLRVSDKTETSEFLEQLKDRGECRGEVKTEK